MKKEYKTPLTEIVFTCVDGSFLTRDSEGDSQFGDANQFKFDGDETTENIQGDKNLWDE